MKKSVAVAQVDKIPVYSNKKVKSIKGNKSILPMAVGVIQQPCNMKIRDLAT